MVWLLKITWKDPIDVLKKLAAIVKPMTINGVQNIQLRITIPVETGNPGSPLMGVSFTHAGIANPSNFSVAIALIKTKKEVIPFQNNIMNNEVNTLGKENGRTFIAVSYTHLTLPTILLV